MRSNPIALAVLFAVAATLTACGKQDQAAGARADQKQTEHERGSTKQAAKPPDEHAHEEAREGAHAGHADEARLAFSADEAAKAGIKVVLLERRPVAAVITLTATIAANQDRLAHIAPRVSGKLVKVIANLGERVAAGQTLALVDSIEIGEAQSAYLQAKSAAGLAQANLQRAEQLHAEQIIPQKDYLAARSETEHSEAALRAAEDRLRTLGLSKPAPAARAQSVYALTAPFTGVVIEKDAVLGELAQPDKHLFTLADLSNVWIDASLFEKDLANVKPGAKAAVTVTAYPDESFSGKLTYVSDTVDRETRTVKARIEVPNPSRRLKPGMFATANVASITAAEALAVPEAAVVLMDGKPTIFVREGTEFEPRQVSVGPNAGGQVILLSGAQPGDNVVIAGAYELKARLLKSQLGEGHAH